jgi:MoaA/NifB/PqqE/SkfB family radical SAM enzyme
MLNLFKNFGKRQAPSPEGSLPDDLVRRYNKSRNIPDTDRICHAPFSNMYFNTQGDVAVCWLTFHKPEKYSPEKTVMDIWKGANFERIRQSINERNLNFACETCKKHLQDGNFVNVLAKAYDNDYSSTDFPSIMEFELSNTCNLACTMCNGLLSSRIRKERDQLPPLKSPYGDKFVQELRGFIPHLKEARFNGGEAFMINLNYKIWDQIFELNPGLRIVAATNGTYLNPRVKEYLAKGNFHLNISIDGFTKETYEKIRIHGDFDLLMENVKFYRAYCREHDRTLCIMINPMRQNWWEMSDFVNWCNELGIHLWYNTIVRPEDQSIWNLPSEKLREIYETLSKAPIHPRKDTPKGIYDYNVRTFQNLVHQQIKTWLKEAEAREKAIGSADAGTMKPEERFLLALGKRFGDSSAEYREIANRIGQLATKMESEIDPDTLYSTLANTQPDTIQEYVMKYSLEELRDFMLKFQKEN